MYIMNRKDLPMEKLQRGKKVIVAMSGGVDSSVSAALLKKAGFDVTGMFMKCWSASDPFSENCSTVDDERMARLAAHHIGIPLYTVNLIQEYKNRVVQYLLNGYKKGITPNPDVMCNKEIKFGLFFEKAMALGVDYIATGHYARLQRETRNKSGNNTMRILQAVDKNKDQSYFLSLIKPEVLDRVLFPIGEYTKSEVRELAKKFGLPNAERKDSQGICFVGKINFADFLKQYILPKPGNIVDTQGDILGRHEGAFYYTVGQRKGLGLSGGPYFVVQTNIAENTIIVTASENDLLQKKVHIKDMHWFGNPVEKVTARIRYRQEPAHGIFTIDKSGTAGTLVFNEPQRAVTPGQMVALYDGEQMLAGGVIV